jgi:hypothetical protein
MGDIMKTETGTETPYFLFAMAVVRYKVTRDVYERHMYAKYLCALQYGPACKQVKCGADEDEESYTKRLLAESRGLGWFKDRGQKSDLSSFEKVTETQKKEFAVAAKRLLSPAEKRIWYRWGKLAVEASLIAGTVGSILTGTTPVDWLFGSNPDRQNFGNTETSFNEKNSGAFFVGKVLESDWLFNVNEFGKTETELWELYKNAAGELERLSLLNETFTACAIDIMGNKTGVDEAFAIMDEANGAFANQQNLLTWWQFKYFMPLQPVYNKYEQLSVELNNLDIIGGKVGFQNNVEQPFVGELVRHLNQTSHIVDSALALSVAEKVLWPSGMRVNSGVGPITDLNIRAYLEGFGGLQKDLTAKVKVEVFSIKTDLSEALQEQVRNVLYSLVTDLRATSTFYAKSPNFHAFAIKIGAMMAEEILVWSEKEAAGNPFAKEDLLSMVRRLVDAEVEEISAKQPSRSDNFSMVRVLEWRLHPLSWLAKFLEPLPETWAFRKQILEYHKSELVRLFSLSSYINVKEVVVSELDTYRAAMGGIAIFTGLALTFMKLGATDPLASFIRLAGGGEDYNVDLVLRDRELKTEMDMERVRGDLYDLLFRFFPDLPKLMNRSTERKKIWVAVVIRVFMDAMFTYYFREGKNGYKDDMLGIAEKGEGFTHNRYVRRFRNFTCRLISQTMIKYKMNDHGLNWSDATIDTARKNLLFLQDSIFIRHYTALVKAIFFQDTEDRRHYAVKHMQKFKNDFLRNEGPYVSFGKNLARAQEKRTSEEIARPNGLTIERIAELRDGGYAGNKEAFDALDLDEYRDMEKHFRRTKKPSSGLFEATVPHLLQLIYSISQTLPT